MYYINGEEHLIVQSKPTVTNDDAITFQKARKLVGKVKAKYDFSELPAEYHQLALQLINKSQVVYVNID